MGGVGGSGGGGGGGEGIRTVFTANCKTSSLEEERRAKSAESTSDSG